jgi:hypothetical protein
LLLAKATTGTRAAGRLKWVWPTAVVKWDTTFSSGPGRRQVLVIVLLSWLMTYSPKGRSPLRGDFVEGCLWTGSWRWGFQQAVTEMEGRCEQRCRDKTVEMEKFLRPSPTSGLDAIIVTANTEYFVCVKHCSEYCTHPPTEHLEMRLEGKSQSSVYSFNKYLISNYLCSWALERQRWAWSLYCRGADR